ncbi:MAG: SH3 domain-containing protein [Bacteroidota bacterium]
MIRTTIFFLSLLSTLLLTANDEIKPYTVTAPSGLSLRDGPGIDYDRISIIPFNETVLVNLSLIDYEQQDTVGEEMGTWYPVTYDGQEGYLFSSYLKYGHLFEPAKVAENINHDYRIVIPGIRMGSLNYDPNLHWYGLYKSPDDEQSPLQIKKVNPQLDLDPFSIEEEGEYIDSGEDVSLDADVGDNYLLLMIGTRAPVSFDEIKTYYNEHYGETTGGAPFIRMSS